MSLNPNPSSWPSLPPEVIFHIIESLIPDPKPIALPASHLVTQTLLSLARVSHLTYPISMRLIYSYCIYLDSFTRLDAFEEALLRLGLRTIGESECVDFPDRDFHVPLLKHITSLYIGPFSEDRRQLDDISDVESICNILDIIGPKIKRLVVSIPNQDTFSRFIEDGEFNPMRETFARLTSLEVFCCEDYAFWMTGTYVGDEENWEDCVSWRKWPKLRVLVLGETDLTSHLEWRWLGEIQELETLVLRYHTYYSDYDVPLERLWRKARQGGAKNRNVQLVMVHERRNRSYKKWPLLAEGDFAVEGALLKVVKVDLSSEESSSAERNQTFQERIVNPMLNGHERFGELR